MAFVVLDEVENTSSILTLEDISIRCLQDKLNSPGGHFFMMLVDEEKKEQKMELKDLKLFEMFMCWAVNTCKYEFMFFYFSDCFIILFIFIKKVKSIQNSFSKK